MEKYEVDKEKRSEQVLVKHQVGRSHMLNHWFSNYTICAHIFFIKSKWLTKIVIFWGRLQGHHRLSESLCLCIMCWVVTWTKYQCECPWSARSWTATQHYRPNLYQSVAAISPCCLACSVASSTEGRACHRVGIGLNSFKVTLWFNGDAFFKTASSFSLLPQCLVHLCHKHWLCISPLAVEAPWEVV